MKKKRKFYYYALVFDIEFENDDDIVYFAFSQPYSYSQVISEILDKEEEIKPSQASLIQSVPRKVVGQNPLPPPPANPVVDRNTTIKEVNEKPSLQRANTMIAPKEVYKDQGKLGAGAKETESPAKNER